MGVCSSLFPHNNIQPEKMINSLGQTQGDWGGWTAFSMTVNWSLFSCFLFGVLLFYFFYFTSHAKDLLCSISLFLVLQILFSRQECFHEFIFFFLLFFHLYTPGVTYHFFSSLIYFHTKSTSFTNYSTFGFVIHNFKSNPLLNKMFLKE